MFLLFNKIVFGMAALRLLSSTIEFTAALLMLKFNNVEIAFKINATLALVGPTIMLCVTSLGLLGLAGKVPLSSMAIILLGVAFIFVGISRI